MKVELDENIGWRAPLPRPPDQRRGDFCAMQMDLGRIEVALRTAAIQERFLAG